MASEIVIEVARGAAPDLLSIRVTEAPSGGEPTATIQLDVDALVRGLPALETTVLASAVAARRALPVAEQQLRQVGERLFRALFTGEVYGAYRASLGVAQQRGEQLRVVLRLAAPELAALPWEALFDPETQTYLCRKEPLVRHVPAPYTVQPLEVDGPLRILVLIASPRDLPSLDVDAESERLSQALAGPVGEGLVELHWLRQATWSAVHDKLMAGPWHVLHFIGHGDYSLARGQGLIALVGQNGRNDLVDAERLADLLHESEPTPRLVVLNSCASGQVGTADLFSGTALALARSGINAVAAMQFSISDEAALAFARGFYTAIAHGRGVDAATRSGRIEILGVPNSLEWVTPVLYLRGDATTLFHRTPRATPEPPVSPRSGPPERAGAVGDEARPPSRSVTPLGQPGRRRWVLVAIMVATVLVIWLGSGPLSGLLGDLLNVRTYPSATRPEGTVRFQAPNSPGVLNPELAWYPGGAQGSGSAGNAYALDANSDSLTLTAGPSTMNWGTAQTAPMILYRVSGDFTAQVRVECDPSLVSNYTGFGFGVRSRSDHATWLQLVRTHALFATRDESGATSHLSTTPYGSSAVHLKIERSGTSFSLGYSENGASWVNLFAGTYANLPAEVDLYLFSFASENPPLSARFSDLRVLK